MDYVNTGPVAIVLGGGGVLGGVQVGMLRALFRADIRPDLVFGASIGAVNAGLLARDPTPAVTEQLLRLWSAPEISQVYGDSVPRQLRRIATRTPLHSPGPLRRLLERYVGADVTFADLRIPLRLAAACVERSALHWFDRGPLLPAVMAAAAVPGLLPTVEVDGEHFLDGEPVADPLAQAVAAGAANIFVLQVGRAGRPVDVPLRPWEATAASLEIARRVRAASDLAVVPHGVRVHLLPGGDVGDENPWAYRHADTVGRRVSAAYAASRDYLTAVGF